MSKPVERAEFGSTGPAPPDGRGAGDPVDRLAYAELVRAFSELPTSSSVHLSPGPTPVLNLRSFANGRDEARRILLAYGFEEAGDFERASAAAQSVHVVAYGSQTAHRHLVDQSAPASTSAIGLGIDHWETLPPDRRYAVPGNTFKILHVSACDEASGIDLLLDAYAQVFGRDDDVSLIIYDTGRSGGAAIKKLSDDIRLRPHFPDVVLIDDPLTACQLKSLYLGCQVFAWPARYCGFALPVAEALMAGLAVVATGHGGHTDYCDSDNSWLVDFNYVRDANTFTAARYVEPSVDSLAQQLSLIFRARASSRFGKAWLGRRKLLQNYTWKDVALRLKRLAEAAPPSSAAVARSSGKIAWITSYNVRCGIGMYVEHLLATQPTEHHLIFASRHAPLVRPDGANVLRTWEVSKSANGLLDTADRIVSNHVSAVVIQFNFGFYNHAELAGIILKLHSAGIVVCLDLHSTTDPFGDVPNYRLADLRDALIKCDRIFVHNLVDLNRLKDAGLSRNVEMFPLGVIGRDVARVPGAREGVPLVTSFGFVFDTKGLVPLVRAMSILKDRGVACRLRMLNAEYDNQHSRDLVVQIRQEIEQLGLGDDVDFCSEFLDDETALDLLTQADLFVNPYQRTNESASAAVRYGLAAGVPVLVTPLSFFDDLGDAVYRMPGFAPTDIADGITAALQHLRGSSPTALKIDTAARHWREQHDYARLSARMVRLLRSLSHSRPFTEV